MKAVLKTIAAFAAAAVVCACTKVGPAQTSAAGGGHNAWTRPGRLIIATNADPKNLNPSLASAQPVLELSMFMYSWTVRFDSKSRPQPDALSEIPTIENGGVSKDGLRLTYKLRKNMKWHDGPPVTCADLKFSWKVVMNPHNNVITTDGYKDIKDIDCTDPYVAVVHMKRVYASYLQQLWAVNGNTPILPEHILAKYNDAKGSFNTAPYQSAPVASGPFKFVSWQRGSEVRMAANPDYYLGKPKLDEVIYKIIPDENTLVTQLQTHEIDLAFRLTGSTYGRASKLPGTLTVAPIVFTYDHIDFNLKRPMFADVRLRRALAFAIDRTAMLEKIQHGLGELTDTFLSPSLHAFAYDQGVMKYPYDPAKAKALLDEIGWKTGADGIRVKNGQRLSFLLSTQTESTHGRQEVDLVQRYWHDVGVDAQIKNYPTSLFFDNSGSGILQGGKYDVAAFAWGGAPDIDVGAIYSGENLAPKGQNALFWANPLATKMMDAASQTVDQAKRIADYKIVQEQFASDVPSIMLWYRKDPTVYNSDLKGLDPTPAISPPFWNTWEYAI